MGADLRTDLPRYRIWRHGQLEVGDLGNAIDVGGGDEWRLVTCVICVWYVRYGRVEAGYER